MQDKHTLYLILGIIMVICCCPVAGILVIIFSIQASSEYQVGKITEYQSKIKMCKIALLIGAIVGLLATIGVLLSTLPLILSNI